MLSGRLSCGSEHVRCVSQSAHPFWGPRCGSCSGGWGEGEQCQGCWLVRLGCYFLLHWADLSPEPCVPRVPRTLAHDLFALDRWMSTTQWIRGSLLTWLNTLTSSAACWFRQKMPGSWETCKQLLPGLCVWGLEWPVFAFQAEKSTEKHWRDTRVA